MTAGINDKLRKYKSLFSTTLSTSIGTGTSDTITLASVTGLPTDTAITLTFDRVDSGGVATPTKLERIRGIISGGNFTAYVRGKDGTTEQAHTAGAVIEMIWNADDLNDMVDWGVVEHNQDGTHASTIVKTTGAQALSNKTLTSPVINTGFSGTAKATSAEVATGTDDTKIVTPLAATGIDTRTATYTNKTLTSPKINEDVALTATSTQLNALVAASSADGWMAATGTWTYASASTITVPSGAAALYQKGDRIKWTQTTVKYGVIVAVADTLLTIAVNTDYTVANAAITDNYYSHQASPVGYPHWFAYTPTVNGTGGSVGTYAADRAQYRFKVDGSSCTVFINFRITNLGSWTGDVKVSTPVTAIIPGTSYFGFAGSVSANNANPSTASRGMPAILDGSETFWIFISNTWNAVLQWSGMVASDTIFINGTYEI